MKNVTETDYFRRGRLASKRVRAFPLVALGAAPAHPTKMLSNVPVFDGWACPPNLIIATKLVSENSGMSLRELQKEMLLLVENKSIDLPYIWWVNPTKQWTRAIHEDANGMAFVKLHAKWHLAIPLDRVGGLAGAQSSGGYEDIPLAGYFILWDNEESARLHG